MRHQLHIINKSCSNVQREIWWKSQEQKIQTKIQRCGWYLFLIMSKFLHSFWPWNCQHLIQGQCEISDILSSLVDSWMQPSSWGFRAMETPTWSWPSHNTERLSRVQLATSLIATVLSTTNFSRGAWKLCYFQLHLVALYYHKLTRCNCIRRSWSQPEFEFQMSQFLARRWSSHELPVWWPHSISIGHKKQGHLDLGPTAFSFCNKEMLIRATTYIQKMQNF